MAKAICRHCGGPIEMRMPVPKSGCDHLYYPDNCLVCSSMVKPKIGLPGWICPACGRGNAPTSATCPCKPFPAPTVTC